MKFILPIIIVLSSLILITTHTLPNIGHDNIKEEISSELNPPIDNIETVKKSYNHADDVLGEKDLGEVTSNFEISYPEINFCYRNDCKRVSPAVVAWFFENEQKQELRINSHFASHIMPYFHKKYFSKTSTQNSKGAFMHYIQDTLPNMTDAKKKYLKSLSLVTQGGKDAVNIKIVGVDTAGTDGKYSNKYIEVDNSKQKLYAWEYGKVRKVINLSGPKYGYQVYGVFPIVDKGIQPIAPGGLYMPYWMAFHYAPTQNSWYGLHGLIWWYEGDSSRVYESLSNIGVRRSAGCIRMLVEDAKYLYDIYQVGDPVLIHE